MKWSFNNRRPTILAVDDCRITQKTIVRILGATYRILVTGSAQEALKIIYKEKIDLLLLDVSMPEIDGIELCRTVRSLSQFADLPIIMVTARDTAFDRIKGQIAGATEYVTKPFDPDELSQLVKQYLNFLPEPEKLPSQEETVNLLP